MKSSLLQQLRQLAPVWAARPGIGRLFALALIPGLLAGSILFYDIYQGERAQLEQGALQTARALSQAVERDLAGIKGKLQILATFPSLQDGDLRTFYRQSQQVLATEALAGAVVLIDRDGQQVMNTLRPFGSALPHTGHPEMSRRTFRTGQPTVSDLYTGSASRLPFVALAVPVWRDGQVLYDLDMGIPAARLNRLLVEQNLPAGWVAALIDSQGVIIARSQNAPATVGRQAAPELVAQMRHERQGTLATRTLEGVPSLVAFSRSDSSGWTLAIGMTRASLYTQLYRPLALAALTLLAFLFGGALMASLFSRHVRAALRTLGAATEAATAGDLDALAPLAGPREIARLAQQFNHMQLARREAEAGLRLAASVFSAAAEAIIICDPGFRIIDVNHSFTELTGYGRDEAIGHNPRFLRAGKYERAAFRAMRAALAATGRWQGEVWDRRKDGRRLAVRMTLSVALDGAGAVSRYIALLSDVTDVRRQQEEIEHLAYYDPLTHLANRRLLADRIVQALALAARTDSVVAVCYLDLDGFKPVNDGYGHQAGDQILIEVARRLEHVVRAHDTVARLGGDEFVLLLTGLESEAAGQAILERVLHTIGAPFTLSADPGHLARISASIGVAFFPADGIDPDVLLRQSDQAMYHAKRAGRNQVQRLCLDKHAA